MNLSSRKQAFLTGTLILTATGFLSRILGFFYRIFLSRTIGAEGLGIYNMIHPVFGICFALCAGSIQTAISRFVAANTEKSRSVFRTGLIISLSMSVILACLIWNFSDFLASNILLDPRCAALLPYMALSVPCSAIHACINGYYYGIQKTKVPAFSQLTEQIVRIGAVFLIADIMIEKGIPITVQLAVFGHLIGEIASTLYTVLMFSLFSPKHTVSSAATVHNGLFSEFSLVAPALMGLALPLMGNRLVLNLLASMEAILIPNRLLASGLSSSDAYSVYGVLTGMAMPFIFFPSAITNSMAVLLLPAVAEAQSLGNQNRISSAITMSLRYSLYMGIFCIGIFTLYGNDLGTAVFHDANAGRFIVILSWLCPFLYLSTTMGSILNGLGKTGVTFLQNVAALLIRLAFVSFGIPRFGITALLWGMLVSEIILAGMHLFALTCHADFTWDAWNMIVKPVCFLLLSCGILAAFLSVLPLSLLPNIHPFFLTAGKIAFLGICYGGFLLLFHKKKNSCQV